jgi:hypothetical protein
MEKEDGERVKGDERKGEDVGRKGGVEGKGRKARWQNDGKAEGRGRGRGRCERKATVVERARRRALAQ